MLIDGPPQIAGLAIDFQADFVQVPFVPRLCAPAAQFSGIVLPKLEAPLPDGFVGENHAPFGQ